jgi:predicted metal-dependent hydrolase
VSGAIDVVRHPRARRAKLSLDPATGRIRLTLPPRAALRPALAWAESQRSWIARQQARLPQARPFVPDSELTVAGQALRLAWCETAPRSPRLKAAMLVSGGPREGFERRIAAWLRREALALLSAETADFALRAGVSVTRVAVGDPKARWGSCSSTGVIRYSWRLILAPDWVRRATVAHEVAHRLHMNHSAEFHAAVERLLGDDPAPARAWLRANGAALHWYGRDG